MPFGAWGVPASRSYPAENMAPTDGPGLEKHGPPIGRDGEAVRCGDRRREWDDLGQAAESAEFLREGAPFLMVPARKRPFASVVASLKWLPGRWVSGSEGAVRVTVTGSRKWNPALAAATAPPDERGAKLPAGTPNATVRLSFVARSVRWIGPSGMSPHYRARPRWCPAPRDRGI